MHIFLIIQVARYFVKYILKIAKRILGINFSLSLKTWMKILFPHNYNKEQDRFWEWFLWLKPFPREKKRNSSFSRNQPLDVVSRVKIILLWLYIQSLCVAVSQNSVVRGLKPNRRSKLCDFKRDQSFPSHI